MRYSLAGVEQEEQHEIPSFLLSVSIASALALLSQQGAHTADTTDVKVGFAAPLTGVNAGYGKDLQNGVQLALDDAAAQKVQIAGKPVHFNLVVQDDYTDPRIGVQAAQALVDQNVSVVVGHFNSGTTIPASVVYDKAGIPVIDPAATNPTLTARGAANMFMVIATDGQNAGNAGKYAVDVTKAKRIAIIDDRTAFGGEADEFEKAVKAAGGNLIGREFTSNQAVDFRAQITSLKAKNPDLIFFGGLDSLAANFIKQMRQLGLNAQFVGGGGVKDNEFIKIAYRPPKARWRGNTAGRSTSCRKGRISRRVSRSASASTCCRTRSSATTRRGRRSRRCRRPARPTRRSIARR